MKNYLSRVPIRIVAFTVIIAMLVSLLPVLPQEASAATTPGNPRLGDNNVTWDCVWFGHYPQTSNGSGGHNNDPIKWRVLSVNEEGEALLLADKNLDAKPYNETYTSVTWETSTVRSWLNGYGTGSNKYGKDYIGDNFINKAFTSTERDAINRKTIQNPDNPSYNTEGGNDTTDKIFFLSIDEVTKPAYGFPSDYSEYSKTRRALNTDYAKSQGAYTNASTEYKGNGWWWLRSPGDDSSHAAIVHGVGSVDRYGDYVGSDDHAIRPALFLNLKSNLWSYAGTVSSEGKVEGTGDRTVVGTMQAVNLTDFTLKIDGTSYPVSDEFDMNYPTEVLNDHACKVVAAQLKGGEITQLSDVTEAVYPKITITADRKQLTYQDGKLLDEDGKALGDRQITGKATITCAVKAPYDASAFSQLQDKGLTSISMEKLRLTAVGLGAYFKKGGLFTNNETKMDVDVNAALKLGEQEECEFKFYVDKDYKPETVTENLSIFGSMSVSGKEYSGDLVLPVNNVDLQRAQQEARKAQRESAKAVADAADTLSGLNMAIQEMPLDTYFSSQEKKRVEKCMSLWISGIIASNLMIKEDEKGFIDKIRKKTGLTDNDIMRAVFAKLGVNEKFFLKSDKISATTAIIGKGKSGQKVTVNCSLDMNLHRFTDAQAHDGFGTLDYYIMDNGRKQKAWSKSPITYADVGTFMKQLQSIAENSIKSVYNEAWGKNADKVAEMLAGKTFNDVLKKATGGTFSDNVFNLLKQPTNAYLKQMSAYCPVDVYVLDADGNVCGAIVDNKVDPAYDSVFMYVEGDAKHVGLVDDDYTIRLVGNGTGTMKYVVEEFDGSDLLRQIQYENIPLQNGKAYYSSVPEGVYLDNAVYDPVSDTQEIVSSASDSWQDGLVKRISVTDLSFSQSQVSIPIGEAHQLRADIAPVDATNKMLDWESQDKAIATVTDEGLVTAVGAGETTIQAKTVDGGFTAQCKVTVTEKNANQTPPAASGNQAQNAAGNKAKASASKVKKLKKVVLKKAKSTKRGALKLTWKRDKKVTGYQAIVATDKKFKKNKKTAWIKKNKTVSKTFTKLKRGKTYFAKVRAYKKIGKKKVYGAYSKVKKAKIR